MHPAPGAAGELPGRGRGAIDDRRDLVKGHGEHVVQDEGQPLGRLQRFQHHQESQADRIGEERFLLRIAVGSAACQWTGQLGVERFLAP
jgi:hypothetical protein